MYVWCVITCHIYWTKNYGFAQGKWQIFQELPHDLIFPKRVDGYRQNTSEGFWWWAGTESRGGGNGHWSSWPGREVSKENLVPDLCQALDGADHRPENWGMPELRGRLTEWLCSDSLSTEDSSQGISIPSSWPSQGSWVLMVNGLVSYYHWEPVLKIVLPFLLRCKWLTFRKRRFHYMLSPYSQLAFQTKKPQEEPRSTWFMEKKPIILLNNGRVEWLF